jgi:hypothetical protein
MTRSHKNQWERLFLITRSVVSIAGVLIGVFWTTAEEEAEVVLLVDEEFNEGLGDFFTIFSTMVRAGALEFSGTPISPTPLGEVDSGLSTVSEAFWLFTAVLLPQAGKRISAVPKKMSKARRCVKVFKVVSNFSGFQ